MVIELIEIWIVFVSVFWKFLVQLLAECPVPYKIERCTCRESWYMYSSPWTGCLFWWLQLPWTPAGASHRGDWPLFSIQSNYQSAEHVNRSLSLFSDPFFTWDTFELAENNFPYYREWPTLCDWISIFNNYSSKWRSLAVVRGLVNIHCQPPTLRWIVVLVYTKTVR